MKRHLILALPALLVAGGALAAPADTVRFFYDDVAMRWVGDNQDRFTGPALAFLQANERAWTVEDVCLDFDPVIDGQDFDEEEVRSTLELSEHVSGGNARVTARFTLFGEPREVVWTLTSAAGAWKVTDIAGEAWALSELPCDY